MSSKLHEIGFTVNEFSNHPKRPNLVAALKGTQAGPNILFVAHVDNIPAGEPLNWRVNPYEAQVLDGRIVGRGVADMKAGLAAMIIAAKAIRESGVPMLGNFSIASVVDEELESEYGMKFLAKNALVKADCAVFGEPSFPYVDIALKGGVWLKLTTFGKSVGSGWPESGVNAVTKMAKVLLELDKLVLDEKSHYLLGRATISPGTTIRGGLMMHSIPDKCEATVDIYTVPGLTTGKAVSIVVQCVEKLEREDPDLKVKIETIFEANAYELEQDAEILLNLQSATESVFGKRAELAGVPSLGDARFMADLRIPSIAAYGPGEKGKGHILDESVEINTLVGVAKVYALTALRTWNP